ncbi:MAG: hypothetical protein V1921_07735 [Candidatus Altiarchaeota archaeon]
MDKETGKALMVVGVAVILIVILLSLLGVYYYLATRPQKVETQPSKTGTQATQPTATPTTVEIPTVLKPVVNVIEKVVGVTDCGADMNCFNQAARECSKAKVIAYTPKVTQAREITGKDGDRCVITYNNTGITDLAEPYWKDLTMTCKLLPEDIPKDILTEVTQPDCSGNMWDRLKPYAKV